MTKSRHRGRDYAKDYCPRTLRSRTSTGEFHSEERTANKVRVRGRLPPAMDAPNEAKILSPQAFLLGPHCNDSERSPPHLMPPRNAQKTVPKKSANHVEPGTGEPKRNHDSPSQPASRSDVASFDDTTYSSPLIRIDRKTLADVSASYGTRLISSLREPRRRCGSMATRMT
jgi:hypothetical protein